MSAGDPVFWLLAGLAGLVYALVIHAIQEAEPGHPYAAMFVVGGVLISLGLAALVVDLRTITILLGVFMATGMWQVFGSMWRWRQKQARERAEREIRKALGE